MLDVLLRYKWKIFRYAFMREVAFFVLHLVSMWCSMGRWATGFVQLSQATLHAQDAASLVSLFALLTGLVGSLAQLLASFAAALDLPVRCVPPHGCAVSRRAGPFRGAPLSVGTEAPS